MLVAGVLGIAGGLGLFALRDRRAEPVAETGTTLLMSIPEFLWALLFIFVFGVALQAMPFTGRLDPSLTEVFQGLGNTYTYLGQYQRDLGLDPREAYGRAIRAYEKAGFEKAGMVDTPDGPALLMVRNA